MHDSRYSYNLLKGYELVNNIVRKVINKVLDMNDPIS